ncbi:cysteine-rich receptor-like protein kinase 10 [Coffea arabica]|uniref:Cysteine-rich receptor-like protein kinase 10 n=1 Tax=Coffea arabica TaxID=13443 RepID=A0A6P6S3I9_COFAR|nr:cysteine-rich receptor-like protein kinase 7 [Coffea arabica]
MALVFLKWRLRKSYVAMAPETSDGVADILTAESLQYSLTEIQIATNNFSVDNKIGEGGFGRVYKAWNHWRRGQTLALLDSSIGDSYARNEVIQCIQVGLLCVEEDASKRHKMASVVCMLNPGSVSLPTPHRPAVFRSNGSESRVDELKVDQSNTKRISAPSSVNDASITEPYPR